MKHYKIKTKKQKFKTRFYNWKAKKTKHLGLITFGLKRWNGLWNLTIHICLYKRWIKGFIEDFVFSGYGKDIRKLRFGKGWVVIFWRGSWQIAMKSKEGNKRGLGIVLCLLDDLRCRFQSNGVRFSPEPNRQPSHHQNINRMINLEEPRPNQTGFIGSVSIRLFGSRVICPGLV